MPLIRGSGIKGQVSVRGPPNLQMDEMVLSLKRTENTEIDYQL